MNARHALSQPAAFRFDVLPPPPCEVPGAAAATAGGIGNIPSRHGYGALLAAFRATGGIARGDDLARLLECLHAGDFISLARLIARGEVFGFVWHETFWVPMFQFELRDLSVNRESQSVLAELAGAFGGWSLAAWFAEANDWLNDRRPVDLLRSEPAAVLAAARADRFIVNG